MANRGIRTAEKKIERIFAEKFIRDKDFVMPSYHCHPYYELYYVEKGACRFFLGDDIYDLHTGDFLMIPPQILHYTRYLFGPCTRSAVFFKADDIDEKTKSVLPWSEGLPENPSILQAQEFARDEFSELLWSMVKEENILDAYSDKLMSLRLCELLVLLNRYTVIADSVPADIHTTDKQIVRAAKYMAENYANPISAAEIADAAGFSQNYLSRRFRKATGIGVHEYLVYLRLSHAALELKSTSDSVTEIAIRCGFSDGNYFKDAFKKHYGKTPREYRRSDVSFL